MTGTQVASWSRVRSTQRAPDGEPCRRVSDGLRSHHAAGMETEQFTDFVVGHGELWCAQLVAAACEVLGGEARFMDTREVLVRAY